MTGVVAFLCGGVFPVLCHLLQASTGKSAGSVVGKVYFANVMGATIGPLLTGFVLFEYISFQETVLCIGILIAIIIVFLVTRMKLTRGYSYGICALCLLISLLGYGFHLSSYDRFFETLQSGIKSPPVFEAFNSSRSGIISVANNAV